MKEKEQEEHVQPIDQKLRPVLEAFLTDEGNLPMFKQFAAVAGYAGDDNDKVIKALFTADPETKEVIFTVAGLYDYFLEWQLLQSLKDVEPYRSLLKVDPSSIRRIRELAKKMYAKEDITNDDLKKVFKINRDDDDNTHS